MVRVVLSDPWPAQIPVEGEEETPDLDAQRKRRIVQHRAELFAAMAQTDAFQEFLREMGRKRERMEKTFTTVIRFGSVYDQRQVDYDRGFMDALDYPAQVVAGAIDTLAKIDAGHEPDEEPDDDGKVIW